MIVSGGLLFLRRSTTAVKFQRRWLARPNIVYPKRRAPRAPLKKYDTLPYAREMVMAAGALLVGGVTFVFVTVTAWGSSLPAVENPVASCSCSERLAVFEKNASKYDASRVQNERLALMPLLRWWLLRKAQGDVLEVACGSCPNLGLYPSHLSSITLTDASPKMLAIAAQKTTKQPVTFRQIKVEDMPFEKKFDTVVDSFGLCSFEDPVSALKNMQKSCKPNGKLLLLEHGRSHFTWLNNLLDTFAKKHLLNWGCNWNRDIAGIAKDAGLQIDTISRYHFGTTYYLVARPDPDLAAPLTKPDSD